VYKRQALAQTTGTFDLTATVTDNFGMECPSGGLMGDCNGIAAAFSNLTPATLEASGASVTIPGVTAYTDESTVGITLTASTSGAFQMPGPNNNTLPNGAGNLYAVTYTDCASTDHSLTNGTAVAISPAGSSTDNALPSYCDANGGSYAAGDGHHGTLKITIPSLTSNQIPIAGDYAQTLTLTVASQ
jgi:hypothetical protein